MTTAQKIESIRDHLMAIDPDELPEHARDFGTNLQIARGLGFDPFDLLLPDDPNELDEMIDGAIGLLLELRGDDLPPFNFRRFMPEPVASGTLSGSELVEVIALIEAGELDSLNRVVSELRRRDRSARPDGLDDGDRAELEGLT